MQVRVRLAPLAVALSLLVLDGKALALDQALLLSRRAGWIEAIDLESLATVSRIRVPAMTDSVAADPSGRRLFVAAPASAEKGCCALFALDLYTMQLSHLIEPAQRAVVTSERIFTQRGNVGIESFDSQSLSRLPTLKAPGVYRLQASPDGRLLVGTASWPEPSLDLFDALKGSRIASRTFSAASNLSGVWLGPRYLLLDVQSAYASLSFVNTDPLGLGRSLTVPLPAQTSECGQLPYDLVAAGGRIVIYPRFGLKERGSCSGSAGLLVVDPDTGATSAPFQTELHLRQLVAGSDGQSLYGLDVGSPAWQQVRIVRIDASSMQIIGSRSLDPDVWYLTMGSIPHEWNGKLDLVATKN